jgi:hypothetical protein
MEEHRANECSVIVYFCATAHDDVYELYHKRSPPSATAVSENQHSPLGQVYENVRTLLDENVGGFEEGKDMAVSLQLVLSLTPRSFYLLAAGPMHRTTRDLCQQCTHGRPGRIP